MNKSKVSQLREAIASAFDRHLDECSQCRNEPFNLCDLGARLLPMSVESSRIIAGILPEPIVNKEVNDGNTGRD